MFLLQTIFHKTPVNETVRTIDHGTVPLDTRYMARYSAFLGRVVEVQYRAGDICLPASGMFVADSGRSIFLEQHYEQCGQLKNFRWEIPYPCIVRLEEVETLPPTPSSVEAHGTAVTSGAGLQANAAGAAARSSLLPLTRRPETA